MDLSGAGDGLMGDGVCSEVEACATLTGVVGSCSEEGTAPREGFRLLSGIAGVETALVGVTKYQASHVKLIKQQSPPVNRNGLYPQKVFKLLAL